MAVAQTANTLLSTVTTLRERTICTTLTYCLGLGDREGTSDSALLDI